MTGKHHRNRFNRNTLMNDKHHPRKRFGQHFLHDRNVIEKIIRAINPSPDETIVEIGPGQGAITLPLLKLSGKLHVVEIDRDLAQHITELCENSGTIHMHCVDVLEFDFRNIPDHKLKIVGNLPYNISTPLIFHLLDQINNIKEMIFMLQEEVVDRITAVPGNKIYGRLSVMVQSLCTVEKLFHVSPGAFNPPPKVDSAVVKLVPLKRNIVKIDNRAAFELIVRECFSQRRKTLRNALRNHLSNEHIQSIDIDPGLRPERLTIDQFAALANLYNHQYKSIG